VSRAHRHSVALARAFACALAACALAACASVTRTVVVTDPAQPGDPADTAPTALAVPDAGNVRVALVPLRAEGLTEQEEELLTDLIAIRLERGGYVVVTAPPPEDGVDPCVDPVCLATVATAGPVRADVTIAASYARLGDADVLTLLAWDVAGRRLVRDAVSAQNRGELPEKLGLVVDDLAGRVVTSLPPLRRPEIKRKLDSLRLDVCTDERGWWFCDAQRAPVTENDFVRRYQNETKRHDLDAALVDRELDFEPWLWIGGGALTGTASLVLTMFVVGTEQGEAIATATDEAWIVVPALGGSAALALLVYGIIALSESGRLDDGSELDHLLDEGGARASVSRYNAAVLARLERESRAPTGGPP
jgi:hypothetical protein